MSQRTSWEEDTAPWYALLMIIITKGGREETRELRRGGRLHLRHDTLGLWRTGGPRVKNRILVSAPSPAVTPRSLRKRLYMFEYAGRRDTVGQNQQDFASLAELGSKPAIEGPSAICLQGHVSPEQSGIQAILNYVVNSLLADPVTDGATFSHSSTPSARCPPNAGLERLEVLKDLGRRAGLFVPSLWSGSDRPGIRIVYTGSRSGRESVSPSASLPPEPPVHAPVPVSLMLAGRTLQVSKH
ncbi:hypothetical protein Bbelb_391990 [Branchiostoma belcheri]|nr:hypothetical protein Bbelb_391990 [Branchiostoma belcheri]